MAYYITLCVILHHIMYGGLQEHAQPEGRQLDLRHLGGATMNRLSIYLSIYVSLYIYIYIYTCIRHIYIYIYIYIHVYIHIYIYICIHMCLLLSSSLSWCIHIMYIHWNCPVDFQWPEHPLQQEGAWRSGLAGVGLSCGQMGSTPMGSLQR